MDFRQLLPEPQTIELGQLLKGLELAELAPPDRPYSIVNFVASADGRASFGGRSGQLGDDGDRAMFHALRAQADAVLAGTVTMLTERYGRLIPSAGARAERERRGLAPEPIACLVSRSGRVPTDIPLFSEPDASIVVFSPVELQRSDCRARVQVVRLDPGEPALSTVMRHLRAEYGVRSLLCEGGPTLFGALLHEGLVDELFLTLAPKLTGGGTGAAISNGPELSEPALMRLQWALERSGSLYLRYAIA